MKGISFKPWKHKAIRDNPDREWQTRRMDGLKEINKEPDAWCISGYKDGAWGFGNLHCEDDVIIKLRYQVGDVVYIKEQIYLWKGNDNYTRYSFDGKMVYDSNSLKPLIWRWKKKFLSPMFLPEEAARDFIKFTGIGLGRLQEITWTDCLTEGIIDKGGDNFCSPETPKLLYSVPQGAYAKLWDSIYPKTKWDTNPWVFRNEFKVVANNKEMR